MKRFFCDLGAFCLFALEVLRKIFTRRYTIASCTEQMYRIGVESISVVNLCSFFIGLVLVIQTAAQLARFGAKTEVSAVVFASFVREIGPVFAAIMFAGRSGTSIAAEIGSMVVTEQIDAYTVFGADPVAKLAVPRVLATTLMLPALTAIACVVGIASGFFLAIVHLDLEGSRYLKNGFEVITTTDVVSCVAKGVLFGLLIGLIATSRGFRTARATEAVGASTTMTMVQCVLAILVLDLILAQFFLVVQGG
jgi:phospholipid/cholesterol/gamma-HCH transport system permease protein